MPAFGHHGDFHVYLDPSYSTSPHQAADIPPAAEIVDRIVNQATILLTSASNRYQIAQ
jgi:hypothetical protein